MNAVEDTKGGIDSPAAKTIALDHLGDIAAKLRSLGIAAASSSPVPTLDEVVSAVDTDGLTLLSQTHKLVDDYLCVSAEQDDMHKVSDTKTTS